MALIIHKLGYLGSPEVGAPVDVAATAGMEATEVNIDNRDAWHFYQNDSFVRYTDSTNVLENDWTISFWFKGFNDVPSSTDGDEFNYRTAVKSSGSEHPIMIARKNQGPWAEQFSIGSWVSGDFQPAMLLDGSSPARIRDSSNMTANTAVVIDDLDSWYHLTAVGDSQAGSTKFYINGTLIGVLQDKASLNVYNIGNHGTSLSVSTAYAQRFADYISDFRVYDEVLDDAEVSSLYSSTDGSAPASSQGSVRLRLVSN